MGTHVDGVGDVPAMAAAGAAQQRRQPSPLARHSRLAPISSAGGNQDLGGPVKAAISLASLALAAILFLSACGGGSGDGDSAGTPGCTVVFGTDADWDFIRVTVFPLNCTTGCHSGGSPAAGLNLETANSHNVVCRPSGQLLTLNLIQPFDPDASYLIKKVRGDPDILGVQMPKGGLPLDAATIQSIETWVIAGAKIP